MNASKSLAQSPWVAGLCKTAFCTGILLLGGCQRPPTGETPAAAAGSQASPAVAEGAAGEGVSLNPEQVERMGIETLAATAASYTPEIAGYAEVMAHDAIAQSVADLATAAAAARQSQAALARAQRLAGTPGAIPADAQESAVRQAAVDQAALQLARQRLSASFGQTPPWKDTEASSVLSALAGGATKLVRVTFPLGALAGAAPASLRLAHLNAAATDRGWQSSLLWDAPANANVPGRNFFAVLKGSDASEGERLLAWAPVSSAQTGVLVPATATIASNGKYWCYVERKPGSFVRTELDTSRPLADGYFIKDGIAVGDKVVTTSAGTLLAREMNPSTEAE